MKFFANSLSNRYIFVSFGNKKTTLSVVSFLNGTPKRIRIAVASVKGKCPRPLDDGGLPFAITILPKQNLLSTTFFIFRKKLDILHILVYY